MKGEKQQAIDLDLLINYCVINKTNIKCNVIAVIRNGNLYGKDTKTRAA